MAKISRPLLDDQFVKKANSPEIWLLEGRRLKRSGDILYEAYDHDLRELELRAKSPLDLHNLEMCIPAMLLYGLSIENLAKGLIIKKMRDDGDPSPALEKNTLKKVLAVHDQTELLEETGVSLTRTEMKSIKGLLKDLTEYVLWAGRYPIPKKMGQMSVLLPNNRAAYVELFDRLEAMY